MITRTMNHYGDDTCASCVRAGDFIYLAHHAGGYESSDIKHQMRAAFTGMKSSLVRVDAEISDMVQIHLYLKDLADFVAAREVFYEFFPTDGFPARMTSTTQFLDQRCLCMLDGVAYKPRVEED